MGATQSFPVVFSYDVSRDMEVGKIIPIKAWVGLHPTRFAINLKCENDDIAFHFNPRFDEKPQVVVCNTYTEDKWGQEERTSQMPFHPGGYFEMAITIQNSYYEVSVHGKDFLKHVHRLPFHKVKKLEFCGDIEFKDNVGPFRPDPAPYCPPPSNDKKDPPPYCPPASNDKKDPPPYCPPPSNDKKVCDHGKPVDSDKTQRTENQTAFVDKPEQDAEDHPDKESQVPLNRNQNIPRADSSDQQPAGCCYCRLFVRSFWIRWTKWRIGGDVVVHVNKAV